jgi:hypothetical protein
MDWGVLSLWGRTGVKLLLSLELSVTLNDANEKQKAMINSGFGGGKNLRVDMWGRWKERQLIVA